MLKRAHISRYFLLPLALAISMFFALVPVALAATHAESQSLNLVGTEQYYLALGDSLAFGFQPNGGYLTKLSDLLIASLEHTISLEAC